MLHNASQVAFARPSPSVPREGFTLAELLVASAIALTVMAAVATLFGRFGNAAADAQSIVDMTNRMRTTSARLRRDLSGITAPLRPPLSPDGNPGYFELFEGPLVDASATGTSSLLADIDDVLLFTTQSSGPPFQGRFVVSGTVRQVESSAAEVAWFCQPSPAAAQTVPGLTLHTLYRRQLLVEAYVGALPFHAPASMTFNQIAGSMPALLNSYDISLRAIASGTFVPNTLGDLTLRENRFLHGAWNTPFDRFAAGAVFDFASGREGEDVVLTNVISFDVRVFDPDARPRLRGSTLVLPTDRITADGYDAQPAFSGTSSYAGCFVDLGRSAADMATLVSGSWVTGISPFTRAANVRSGTGGGLTATYDTWSTAYEINGINEDNDSEDINGNGSLDSGEDLNGNGVIDPWVDEARDGLDQSFPRDGLPDDAGETETAPPYSTPLTAVEILIRCYDPVSRQVRQVTVRQSFAN